jgi:hypothetical protein
MSLASFPLSRTPHNAFGTIAQAVDANHYAVVTNWGQMIEATYYRASIVPGGFVPGEHVFMERLGGSALWMITGHARGDPGGSSNIGWFEVDNLTWGLIDGPGRIVP